MGLFYLHEIILFGLAQHLITLAYFIIPDKTNRVVRSGKIGIDPTSAKWLSKFVHACGAGHLMMFWAMVVLMGVHQSLVGSAVCRIALIMRPDWVTILIWGWIVYDWRTALISLYASRKLTFTAASG